MANYFFQVEKVMKKLHIVSYPQTVQFKIINISYLIVPMVKNLGMG
jgi:hypothetical protein